MKFYYHQESYGVIDRTEIKRILKIIANNKSSGACTSVEYELRARKTYDLKREHRFWGEEFIDIKYRALTKQDIHDMITEIRTFGMVDCMADKFLKEYKIKLGFYRSHDYNYGYY